MKIAKSINVASYFGICQSEVSKQKKKQVRLDYVYIVFTEPSLTLAQKKEYIFSTSLSTEWKEKLWERHLEFIGILDMKNRFKN